ALGAYLVPHLVQRTPLFAFALGLAPLAFTLEAAVSLGDHPDIAAAIEQGAPLGKTSLAWLRKTTDRDHDGYGAYSGGGDCDDRRFAGYPKAVSPHLDELAARSVVFDRAYSLASYTGKSLGPLLVGKYPSETHRGWGHFNRFATDDLFVSERLQKAGIHTISV